MWGENQEEIDEFLKKSKKADKQDEQNKYYWKYYTVGTYTLVEQFSAAFKELSKAGRKKPITPTFRMFDVGCGAGNVFLVARTVHEMMHRDSKKAFVDFRISAHGIEHDESLAVIARETAKTVRENIIVGNVLETDIDYSSYDLIYYYWPIKNVKIMKLLEHKIEDEMKSGAILIANYKQDEGILRDKRFKRVVASSNVFIKK